MGVLKDLRRLRVSESAEARIERLRLAVALATVSEILYVAADALPTLTRVGVRDFGEHKRLLAFSKEALRLREIDDIETIVIKVV